MIQPINEVIPREIPGEVIPIVTWFADSLDEIENFGSNVMSWDAHPKTDGEENVVPIMLFRHYLDIIDSISILVRHGTGDPPKILTRAALEGMLYLEYLFEKDTLNRSMAFLFSDFLKQIKTANTYKTHAETMSTNKATEKFAEYFKLHDATWKN